MLTISGASIQKAYKALANIKDGAPRALSRGINDALKRGATIVKREIRKAYLIKYRDVPIETRLSDPGSLAGSLEVRHAGMLKLYDFKVSPRGVQKRAKKSPITGKVRVDGGGVISHGFIARMSSGHVGAFVRDSTKKMPSKPWKDQIKELHTINAAIMVGGERVAPLVEEGVQEHFEKRIDHHIKFLLK
jgi:hypothetical protein